ncbi:hypothetical protein, partial [Sinorhizobium sp. 6-117]|uniref:hypothetical protein n=1 Tax=Sinorhizobium sp. 6-117 TaxID=3049090 RepID=UPI0024C39113
MSALGQQRSIEAAPAPARSLASRLANLPISARVAALTAAGLISLILSSVFLTQALYRSAEQMAETRELFDRAFS